MPTKNILLVEDEFLIALQKQQQLENYNYHVVHVSSGEEAVDYVLTEKGAVDVILMDINLGAMPGTEAARTILRHKNIPLVFLSSHSEPEIVQQTEHISAYGYVLKNSSIVVLDASIKMALKLFDAKKKIELSETFRRKMFESSKFPIIVLETENYTCIDCNEAAIRIYGLNHKDELLGKTMLDYSAPEQVDGMASVQKLAHILQFAKEDGNAFFHWRNKKLNGVFWDAEIHLMSFESEGKILLQYTLFDVTTQRQIELETLHTQKRLAEQRTTIAQLVTDPEIFDADFYDASRIICQMILDTLQVSRVSIWVLNDMQTELTCTTMIHSENEQALDGLTLATESFPRYLETILSQNRIISSNTLKDDRTSELHNYYLHENIHSMMDAGFFVKGKLCGVVCAEDRQENRTWQPDEESFISNVAAVVGQIFAKENQVHLA